MIVNKINIEGVKEKAELKSILLRDSKVFNSNISIKIKSIVGIKDIIQISLEPSITYYNNTEFKDGALITLSISTNFKLLCVENKENNNLTLMEEINVFNYSFQVNSKCEKKYKVSIIDCYFTLVDKNLLIGTLTYLFTEEAITILNKYENIDTTKKYRFIDLFKEFN